MFFPIFLLKVIPKKRQIRRQEDISKITKFYIFIVTLLLYHTTATTTTTTPTTLSNFKNILHFVGSDFGACQAYNIFSDHHNLITSHTQQTKTTLAMQSTWKSPNQQLTLPQTHSSHHSTQPDPNFHCHAST